MDINKIVRYFDVNAHLKALRPGEVALTGNTKARALPQWFALLAGVIIQPYLTSFRATGHWNFGNFFPWVFFALIVAVVIFPAVYRASFDDSKPWFVHLCPIFTAGLGWEALFGTVVKAASDIIPHT
jgi:hypothetical protein